MVRGFLRRLRTRAASREASRGALLIEVLIALAILGMISVAFIGGMYTSLSGARVSHEQSTGFTLAKSQMELAKARGLEMFSSDEWDYTVDSDGWTAVSPPDWLAGQPSTFIKLADEYQGYSVEMTSVKGIDLEAPIGTADEGIRIITATALHNGVEVFKLENYEAAR